MLRRDVRSEPLPLRRKVLAATASSTCCHPPASISGVAGVAEAPTVAAPAPIPSEGAAMVAGGVAASAMLLWGP